MYPLWVPQSIEIGLSFSAVGCNPLESQLLVMPLGQNINKCLVFGESHATVIRGCFGYLEYDFRNDKKLSNFFKGLRLWYLMPLSTIFQLYHGSQFYWWRKATVLSEVADKLYHNVISNIPRLSGIQTHNVSGDRH